MGWDQIIVLVALLIGSGAAAVKDRWLPVVVLWMNFAGTLALYDAPFAVGVLDIFSVSILLFLGSRRDYIVAGLFVVMIVLYRFEEQLGRVVLYDIVNLLACAQSVVIGGGGFGELLRNFRSSLRDLRHSNPGYSMGAGHNADGDSQGNMDSDKKRGVSE